MLPAKKRGLTTQNTAPSVSSGAACAFVAMVTMTCLLIRRQMQALDRPKLDILELEW